MDSKAVRQEIIMTFKINGFSIRKECCSALVERLSCSNSTERKKLFSKIVQNIQNQQLNLPVVEKEHLNIALKEIDSCGLDESEPVLSVINVFDIPKFKYSFERKKFMPDTMNSSIINLYPSPTWKAQYLIDRYNMILQRTLRNKLFTTETLVGLKKEKTFNLKNVENLLSSSSRIDEVIVLGLISQLTEGTYYLEDLTGAIPLNLSLTRFHSGLFTEYCFVLAEGYYEDKMFHVMGLVMPPAEPRNLTQEFYGNINTFGGQSKISLKNSINLSEIERENEDGMIVFLADVWLDDIKLMEKLKSLFSGYNEFPPIAVVFMGDFLSCPYGYEQSVQLKTALKSLADLLGQFTHLLETTKFIFVPGIGDPPSNNILPRTPLPDVITDEIRSIMGDRVIFTTNPCRIQYCTQEIIVLRQNLVTKMCRNSIRFPDTGDIPEHLAKTLLSQCTLFPLSIGIQPVYWQHTDAFSLYPIPDLVVIADHFQPYTRACQNCLFMNPGSFPRTEYSFKVYVPSSKTVEDSQIPKEDK